MTPHITLCPMPWVNLSIYADGSTRLCCFEDFKGPLNLAYNINSGTRNYLTLKETSLLSLINSDSYNTIRNNFLNGTIPPSCAECINEEHQGITSRRLTSLQFYPLKEEKLREITDNNGRVKTTPLGLDIRFNTLCNHTCRMCGPHYSSKWADEYAQLKCALPFVHDFPSFTSSVVEKPSFRKQILQIAKELRSIYITGGEAMLNLKHWEFLQFLIDNNIASHICLGYNINMSYIPDNAPDFWSHFKYVSLGLSLDAVGKRCEYLRHGLKWADVIKNMKTLQNAHLKNMTLEIQPSITWMNVYYIDELYSFMSAWNLKKMFLNFVYTPSYLAPWILPETTKKNILRKLQNHLPDKDFQQISRQLMKIDSDYDQFRKGILFNKWLDKNRSEDFSKTFPELFNLIQKYWNKA
ncbi:MAG: twitch domain-containing radical SAM protein [Spirochaetales bacterium]|nr:twitch domain-containing radical SAM protein [Spirochaetales bacterium]